MNKSIFCVDDRLKLENYRRLISKLIHEHPVFKHYAYSDMIKSRLFMLVSDKGWVGFCSKIDDLNIYISAYKLKEIAFEELIDLLSNKEQKSKKIKSFELFFKISLDQEKIDNFDLKRYS